MKRRFFIAILLISVTTASIFSTACGKTKKTNPKNQETLLSFESYEDITGAGLRMNHYFGKTEVNKERKYVTEGEASWLLKLQGDYSKEDGYPSFALNCIDRTITTADFSNYEKVLLDVYNTTNEEITIKWRLTVHNTATVYTEAEEVTSVLKPKKWTTCEYELAKYVPDYLDLTEVKYISFTIMDKKDTKEDTPSEIYVDNLRGLLKK